MNLSTTKTSFPKSPTSQSQYICYSPFPVTPRVSRRHVTLAALPTLLFAYVLFIRTRHVSQSFWLLGDQILYWRWALGSWRDLPAGGGPTSVGGTTLGPIFVWTVWAIRHLVGPWTQNLPHSGSIGLSIIQSAADAVLFVAIWRRFDSMALGLATVLVVASAPYDMAFNATIWNPPLAVAFVKISLAIILLADRRESIWWAASATAAALLAAQSHSSAIFFAVPVAASFLGREMLARRWVHLWRQAAALTAVVALLEIPYLANLLTTTVASTRPTMVVRSVADTLAEPQRLRPVASFAALVNGTQFILVRPWAFSGFGLVLVACAAMLAWRARRDLTLLGATVAPMLCAVIGFSFWQNAYDHYWFLTIAPSAALTMTIVATSWRKTATPVAWLLVALAIVAQPWRLADALTFHRLPEYGALVEGSREIRSRTSEVRAIETEFALPPSTDRTFLFEVLGGRVTPQGRVIATIQRSGQAIFRPVQPDATARTE